MIKENVVKVPFRKLKYIHHISDIQIRNLKRHKEYDEVFERTYEEVKKYKDNSVVYIGGDIAHSKTDMSPELVDQLSRLLSNLSDISIDDIFNYIHHTHGNYHFIFSHNLLIR